MDSDQLYTIDAVAEVLGLGRRTVYRLIAAGELGYIEVSPARKRCTWGHIEAYLRAKSRNATRAIPLQKRVR